MSKEFILITPVWGKDHIQLFLDIGLPSLFAADNIPKLKKLSRVKYFIYTKACDLDFLKMSKAVKALQALVEVSIIVFEDRFSNNHSAMNWCHQLGFKYAQEHASYAVFIPPDCIWSNQSMYAMYKIVERGYKIIHMSGLRLIRELVTKTIERKDDIISLSSRELVKFGLPFIHPITESHFFDEKDGGLMPANLFWTVDETGILARCFHLHPLVVYGTDKRCDFQSTIDDDLALVFDSDDGEEYIVTDSDELIAFEISSLSHKVLAAYRKGNTTDIANWAQIGTNKKHHSLIKKSIRIHSGEANHPGWLRAQQVSDAIIVDVFQQMAITSKLNPQKIWFRIQANRLFQNIFAYYAASAIFLMNIFHRLMRSSYRLYPWHWNFPFQLDVCTPFINEIKNNSGNILYFDDKYHPLVHELNNVALSREDLAIDLRDLKILTNKSELFTRIYSSYYDLVVIRDFELPLINIELAQLIHAVLKPQGKLLYYFTQNIDIDNLKLIMPSEFQFISEKNYGGIGTKFFLNKYHKIYKSVSAAMQHRTIVNSIKLLLSPFLIVLYPIISAITISCNFVLRNNSAWAVKKVEFLSLKKGNPSLSYSSERIKMSQEEL